MSVEVKDSFQWPETKMKAMNFYVNYPVCGIFKNYVFFLTNKIADIFCRKFEEQESTKQK